MLVKYPTIEFKLDNNDKSIAHCHFIEFHVDTYKLSPKGTYTIKVIANKADGVLVHWVNGKFVIDNLETNSIVEFVAKRRHSYMPRHIAEEVVKTQSVKPANSFFKELFAEKRIKYEAPRYKEPTEHSLEFIFLKD